MLAYDDEYSIQYFKKNLRPYWRRNGDDAAALLKKAAAEYESLKKRCEKFDAELMAALTKAGGEKYAQICALAYRQCYAAQQGGRRCQRPAAHVPQGELQQRLHRHGGRDLPDGAAVPAVQPVADQGHAGADPRLRRLAALALALCAARPGHLPAGQWPGLWRRRAHGGEPDARRGDGQHAHPAGRAGAGGGQRRFLRQILAGAGEVGRVSQGQGLRSGEPALHGRLCRATWRTT